MRRHGHDRAIDLGKLIFADRAAPGDTVDPELAALQANVGSGRSPSLMQDQNRAGPEAEADRRQAQLDERVGDHGQRTTGDPR